MSTAAVAAPAVDPKADADNGGSVSEVIVTATRRDTLLQATPIAITAVSGAAIDRQHIEDFENIAVTTPSLTFRALSRQEAYPSIRGTTTGNDAPGSDLGVSVFIDDVPTTGVADNDPNLFDLQSIEVLRGPQGTLFGENVTGGALVVHTLAPSFDPQGKFEATYGNDNLFEGRGYVTGPIIANILAGKFTFDVRDQDGIINNAFLHTKDDFTRLGGGRGQLLWTPTDNLRVRAGADYSVDTSSYKNQQLFGNYQPSLFPHLSYGPSDTNQAVDPTGHSTVGGGFVRADYTMPGMVFTSITGYRHADSHDFFSTIADPLNENVQAYHVRADQLTQEFHLASNSDDKLSWLVGAFVLDARRTGDKVFHYLVPPGIVANFTPPYSSSSDFSKNDDQTVHSRDYAVFGDVAYAFTPQWKLDLSGRYTSEEKTGHSEVNDTSGAPVDLANGYGGNIAAAYSHTWTAFNPKVILTYTPNSHVLAYASFATGFKSGGYDTNGNTPLALATPFLPETVTSYEVGLKVTALDDRLIVNTAIYDADYTNLQVSDFNPATFESFTSNAGKANIPGIEVESVFNPINWLTLSGNVSYMDAKYTKYVQQDGANLTGNQIPFDAKTHATLGADVHFVSPTLGGGEVRIGADVSYQSKQYFQDDNSADWSFVTDHSKINGLVNLHVNWTSPDKTWQVSFWGNNISDTRYIINATNIKGGLGTLPEFLNPADQVYVGDWNMPRMYGVSLTYKY
ncbi:MAG TPA: TonB-dependent receptor [Phenylobacterium sp.]|uniref:TonB-dependent receptor n=1 Tax=Phenylobacterium sp. TaxID=1871053 RepID=UPI002D4CAA9A|nr:TonB-dependent receptor [Phenylobacterium sp.]HZZ69514.1 TonB-dependent receptor [Phenylobacterium sp.]